MDSSRRDQIMEILRKIKEEELNGKINLDPAQREDMLERIRQLRAQKQPESEPSNDSTQDKDKTKMLLQLVKGNAIPQKKESQTLRQNSAEKELALQAIRELLGQKDAAKGLLEVYLKKANFKEMAEANCNFYAWTLVCTS